MTPWADLVPRLARARGWTVGELRQTLRVTVGWWRIRPSAWGSGFRITHWAAKRRDQRAWTVDAGTALVALLLHGVAVDVGPCPVCEGRRTVESESGTISQVWSSGPCPTCTIDGTPTGREVVDGARLILDAATACDHCGGSGREVDAVFHAEEIPADGDPAGPCSVCKGDPGDPKARETLAVHGDRLQAEGDDRGTVLAAWLRGECPTCRGSGDAWHPALREPVQVKRDHYHERLSASLNSFVSIGPGMVVGFRGRRFRVQTIATTGGTVPVDPCIGETTLWRLPSTTHTDIEAIAPRDVDDAGIDEPALVLCEDCPACHGHGTILGAHADLVERLVVEVSERTGRAA